MKTTKPELAYCRLLSFIVSWYTYSTTILCGAIVSSVLSVAFLTFYIKKSSPQTTPHHTYFGSASFLFYRPHFKYDLKLLSVACDPHLDGQGFWDLWTLKRSTQLIHCSQYIKCNSIWREKDLKL